MNKDTKTPFIDLWKRSLDAALDRRKPLTKKERKEWDRRKRRTWKSIRKKRSSNA